MLMSSMKAAAMSGISFCKMKETSPCKILTELVAPIGRLVSHKRPRGVWKVVRSHDRTDKLL